MNSTLIELALRGTIVSAVVVVLDLLIARYQKPEWRRAWWLIVPLAWLLPLHLPHSEVMPSLPIAAPVNFVVNNFPGADGSGSAITQNATATNWPRLGLAIWLAGALTSFLVVVFRTALTDRRWSRVRLSTDPQLLDLLEDSKAVSGVRAPIGLVLTSRVSSPALLGWLRPRIILPEALAATLNREELRGVFLHELAHFKAGDIPTQWAFCLAQSLHWFNPLAHLATRRWLCFRELAADATAMRWMPDASREAYGHALLAAVRDATPFPVPQGALALGESFQQLRLRLTMITHSQNRTRFAGLASFISLALLGLVLLPRALSAQAPTADAAAKSLARAGGDSWLALIDDGKYAESWQAASSQFKGAITSEKWVEAVEHVRPGAGKLISRNFVSAAYQKDPVFNQKTLTGEFVIEQFDSSFENLKHAHETVSLTKDADGQWRVTGYFIKPN